MGGSIRGFLNDGTTDFKSHRSVDSLAFGHCDYPYRNLGRPSVVKVKHTNSVFQVSVDDNICFTTSKVALPAGNTFGISAATPENPDSFEVFKFVLESAAGQGQTLPPPTQENAAQHPIFNQRPAPVPQGNTDKSFESYFQNLNNQIQLQNKATSTIIQDLKAQAAKAEERSSEILRTSRDLIQGLESRLQRMEQTLQTVQRDLESKDYSTRFNQLHDTLRSSHLSLSESLQGSLLSAITASTPRMGFFLFLVIAFQVVLAASYVIYKRRRANMPKKFL
ncbi:hypothetical protein N7470_003524 [Penicillium chermesinum]|nr:hypothetical protein N7470_003524 [Penicillium chermesinum]